MTIIEQEFFEAFNVPKKEIYIGKKKEQLCNHCEDNCFGWDNKEYKYIYPPITPEIVLGLEEIIIEKFGDIYWDKKGVHKDGYKMYRCKCTLQNDEINAMWAVGKTKKDTLIDLCRYLKNDGIQDQVKALFNA